MQKLKLFMVLIGGKPSGRHIEQHDMFFGIGESLRDLVPEISRFWPEAGRSIHVDAWREVTVVDGHAISVVSKAHNPPANETTLNLFFLNLGGYKENEFDEFHYKFLSVAKERAQAIQAAKQTAFYKHTGLPDAPSHIDEKYGVDVDDVLQIDDILAACYKDKYSLEINATDSKEQDQLHLGYFLLDKI